MQNLILKLFCSCTFFEILDILGQIYIYIYIWAKFKKTESQKVTDIFYQFLDTTFFKWLETNPSSQIFKFHCSFLVTWIFPKFALFPPLFIVSHALKKNLMTNVRKNELGFVGNVFIFKLSHRFWKSVENFLRFSLFSMGEICKIKRREKRNRSSLLFQKDPSA